MQARSHQTIAVRRREARGRAVGSNDVVYANERLFANLRLACHQANPVLPAPMQKRLIGAARPAR
jgi:hypothetical protein